MIFDKLLNLYKKFERAIIGDNEELNSLLNPTSKQSFSDFIKHIRYNNDLDTSSNMGLDFREELKNRELEENFANFLANPSSFYDGCLSSSKITIENNPFYSTPAQKESSKQLEKKHDEYLSSDNCSEYMRTKKD